MPRPALGKAARRKVVAVRVTEAEAAALTAKYGSVSRALRMFINEDLKGDKK